MVLHFSTMVPIRSYHPLSKITNLSRDIYKSKTIHVCTPCNGHFFPLKIYRAPSGNGITQSFSWGIDLKRGVGWRISTTRKNIYLVASISTNQVHRFDMIEFCGLVGGWRADSFSIFLTAIVIFQVGCERYIKIFIYLVNRYIGYADMRYRYQWQWTSSNAGVDMHRIFADHPCIIIYTLTSTIQNLAKYKAC